MSSGLDLSQFYETFFDEADELLAQMEQLLLELDVGAPDIEQLNAIFRAAHSIKGGAATFGCFNQLAGTTHLLENLLDAIRRGEMALRTDMIDIFLETKDVLKSQLDAYRASEEPDEAVFERICAVLRQLALEHKDPAAAAAPAPAPVAAPAPVQAAPEPAPVVEAAPAAADAAGLPLRVRITKVSDKDAESLLEEMGNLGQVKASERANGVLTVWVDSTCTPDDIEAVCCFIVDADQLNIAREAAPVADAAPAPAVAAAPVAATPEAAPAAAPAAAEPAVAESAAAAEAISQAARTSRAAAPAHVDKESTSIRVGVEKVDQVINLVGELVITQAMLAQTASTLDPVLHDRLLNGMEQLERNARDLQEAVMSIRMMPMDYVFSRFPRLVRDIAGKMGK
ncbi:MAG: Hpt domain-containing protein, partial [Achromobacter ruhlandii]